jgi:hypothetical protein
MMGRKLLTRRFTLIIQLTAILLGGLQAWDVRYTMDGDGISYLDIGDAYLRGDWANAINAYWSPFYSWLLGLAMFILKPSAYWESGVVHLVNFIIYLWALICFHVFLVNVIRYNRHSAAASGESEAVVLPVSAWIAFGYCLFLLSSLEMITLRAVTPDMIVSAFVYLASSLLIRIYMGSARWMPFVFLGGVLGVSYLAKATMFPISFVFLGLSLFSIGNLRHAIPRVLVAVFVFLMVAGPFITALSVIKGRLTFSDTPRLNYAWWVGGVPTYIHWQGEPRGTGTPKHPTRKIFDTPAVYEFGTPIGGTYPPWYDPSYWHEGLILRFDVKRQLSHLASSVGFYADLLIRFPKSAIITTFLLLCVMAGTGLREFLKNVAGNWILAAPAIAALVMYSLVHVEWRFLGSFIVLLFAAVAASIRVAGSNESKRLLAHASTAMLVVIVVSFGILTLLSVANQFAGKGSRVHSQWQVAKGLENLGIRPGDKVAFIGDSLYEYWARLARVRIVADIPGRNVAIFWNMDDMVRSRAIEAVAKTGAKFIVTKKIGIYPSIKSWQRIANTDYYAHALPGDGGG